MNATAKVTPESQLMREALDAAMKLIAEIEQIIEDYDDQLEQGLPVTFENVAWMRERVSDLEHAAEGFRAYTLE
ncbi:MAG: hypothetical protein ACLQUT_10475 [Thermoleophilia bacterium]